MHWLMSFKLFLKHNPDFTGLFILMKFLWAEFLVSCQLLESWLLCADEASCLPLSVDVLQATTPLQLSSLLDDETLRELKTLTITQGAAFLHFQIFAVARYPGNTRLFVIECFRILWRGAEPCFVSSRPYRHQISEVYRIPELNGVIPQLGN